MGAVFGGFAGRTGRKQILSFLFNPLKMKLKTIPPISMFLYLGWKSDSLNYNQIVTKVLEYKTQWYAFCKCSVEYILSPF